MRTGGADELELTDSLDIRPLPAPLPALDLSTSFSEGARHRVARVPKGGVATIEPVEVQVFREISPTHIAIILTAFIVLFGYKKLPDATRSIGRSMRIFKSEVKGLHDERAEAVPAPVDQPDALAADVKTV